MKLPIYLDNHATTPMDPRVLNAMLPWFSEKFGNAASRNHAFGWEAEEAVENARKQIASLVGANAKEIIFTSGATESDNLAVKGVAQMYAEKGNHIITAASEHKAILDTCKHLEKEGCRVTYLPLKADGLIDLDMLTEAITDKTILVSIMYANNEIGVLQPVREIGRICRERGVLFHTDAVQAIGTSLSTSIPTTLTSCRLPATSFTDQRGPERSTSAAAIRACKSRRKWMEAGMSAACVPVRSMFRVSWGWVKPAQSPSARWPMNRPASASCATT
jgi:cysteine desulfurase